jgi:Cu/Ag efflux protein CusF
MKKLALILGFALAATGGIAHAATHELDMSQAASQASQNVHTGTGMLKAVNTGKVRIAHQPIDSLGWPAMTMWFALRDPLPDEVRVGDGVRFELEQVRSKEWAITRIERKR